MQTVYGSGNWKGSTSSRAEETDKKTRGFERALSREMRTFLEVPSCLLISP